MMIDESLFNQLLDDLMMTIEDMIDESDSDIDYENSGGILTLTCENGTQVILSRQTPVRQLWMAAKSGGFHFDYDQSNDQWVCKNNKEPLIIMLNRCLTEQSNKKVALSF